MNCKDGLKGILWFVISIFASSSNDILMKYLAGSSTSLPPLEITFFRYFFALCVMLPIIFRMRLKSLITNKLHFHAIRGLMLFAAISLWCTGVSQLHVANATLVSFTIPIFILMLAPLFLKEKVHMRLWIATLVCFGGVLFLLNFQGPRGADTFLLIMLFSAFLFAALDIINKKMMSYEGMVPMLFYSNFFTCVLAAMASMGNFVAPTMHQLFLLSLLGIGANGVLFCILKAFQYINASALSPYRYCELLISLLFGYVIFHEVPSINTIISACIIIPSTLYVAWYDARRA